MPGKRRSGCPVSIALDILGDRWSLLIVRDLMVRGHRTFKDFRDSGEGIATNILADRLKKLEEERIVAAEAEESDARRVNYRLTEKGIALAPALFDLLVWGAYYGTDAPPEMIDELKKNREFYLSEVKRRWEKRDTTPLIPNFDAITGGKQQ